MLNDWATFAGTEIFNSARAATYMARHGIHGGCPWCPTLLEAIDEPDGYTTPAEDEAPWWDPGVPESSRVLGIYALNSTGWDDVASREPIARVREGALLGNLRMRHREMAFTVVLVALDECALSYGKAWLAQVLRGSACGPSLCGGDELCMFACCPCTPPAIDSAWGDAEIRYLYDVGLIDPLREVTRFPLEAGCAPPDRCGRPVMAQLTFTLAAGRPYLYRMPFGPRQGPSRWYRLGDGAEVKNFDPDSWDNDCPTVPDCLLDPDCPLPPQLPGIPIPTDPCYPRSHYDGWKLSFAFQRKDTSQTLEAVPLLLIRTGTKALRRLVVRFIPNPGDIPCDQIDECLTCTQMIINYLPPGAVITVDGRTETAEANCPSPAGTATSPVNLLGVGGRAFDWPVFTCGAAMCVQVIASNVSDPNAEVSLQLVHRQDLG